MEEIPFLSKTAQDSRPEFTEAFRSGDQESIQGGWRKQVGFALRRPTEEPAKLTEVWGSGMSMSAASPVSK
jgi:hypothetical protein